MLSYSYANVVGREHKVTMCPSRQTNFTCKGSEDHFLTNHFYLATYFHSDLKSALLNAAMTMLVNLKNLSH